MATATKTTAYYIHTSGFDALVIIDRDGARIAYVNSAETFRAALAVGDAQHLDHWSGAGLPRGLDLFDAATHSVLAVNDGTSLRVRDAEALASRRAFYCREAAGSSICAPSAGETV